jgi:prepilin-type N-terminal cleavage/methylation domain-containing protein
MFKKSKGFTLIELMIVIAIIGILAAIAIPNFISYRNKSFCTGAESDANAVAGEIANYFSVPTRTALPTIADLGFDGTTASGNTVAISSDGSVDSGIIITITEENNRCPEDYRSAVSGWNASNHNYVKNME